MQSYEEQKAVEGQSLYTFIHEHVALKHLHTPDTVVQILKENVAVLGSELCQLTQERHLHYRQSTDSDMQEQILKTIYEDLKTVRLEKGTAIRLPTPTTSDGQVLYRQLHEYMARQRGDMRKLQKERDELLATTAEMRKRQDAIRRALDGTPPSPPKSSSKRKRSGRMLSPQASAPMAAVIITDKNFGNVLQRASRSLDDEHAETVKYMKALQKEVDELNMEMDKGKQIDKEVRRALLKMTPQAQGEGEADPPP